MPTVPSNTKCSDLGCNNPRSRLNSHCLKHGGIDNIQARESDSIYQTPAWRSIRARQLSIQPLCQSCFSRGQIAQAEHVDHVFPWKHINKSAFTNNIFQSLCKPCHSTKTGLEKQDRYMHYDADGVHEYVRTDYAHFVGAMQC